MSERLAPYAQLYASPAGPGDQRPTALQIVKDEDLVNKWTGKVALVTGGTSGIGVETVRALHATGADVYFTARDAGKGAATHKDILSTSQGKGRLEIIEMDMDSLESVKKAANDFLKKSSTLNILVNNAGIMATPLSKTADGFERQFGVNHIAHFLLVSILMPTLISSSSPQLNSRVICVSSSSHRFSQVRWDDYNWEKPGEYDPFLSYGQSKTANIWMANYIDRVFGPRGVHGYSLHPGGIFTGLQSFVSDEVKKGWMEIPDLDKVMMSAEQGAATSIWAAVAKVWEGKGGKYLSNSSVAPPAKTLTSAMEEGAAPHVYDPESEDRLWKLSEKLVAA